MDHKHQVTCQRTHCLAQDKTNIPATHFNAGGSSQPNYVTNTSTTTSLLRLSILWDLDLDLELELDLDLGSVTCDSGKVTRDMSRDLDLAHCLGFLISERFLFAFSERDVWTGQ